MAATKKLRSKHGIRIDLWDTCFKLDGMHNTVFIGQGCSERIVLSMVDSICDHLNKEKAKTPPTAKPIKKEDQFDLIDTSKW